MPPRATAADAQRANVNLAELEQGRTLLIQRCGKCHQPPMPKEFPAALWPEKVGDMAERAKIDAVQRGSIEQYLQTMSSR
jgi:hypothetical protein